MFQLLLKFVQWSLLFCVGRTERKTRKFRLNIDFELFLVENNTYFQNFWSISVEQIVLLCF